MQIVHKHSAGGILFRDNEVLVIHWAEPRNSYDFPKGTIEENESAKIACVREVLEETGYAVTTKGLIGRTRYEYDWFDGTHIKKIVDYFLLQDTGIVPVEPHREQHETFENVWLTIDEARKLLTRSHDIEILEKAILAQAA